MNSDNRGTNKETVWYNGVGSSSLVQILGQSPRSGVGVVRLDGGARPRRISIGISQEITVSSNNGDHDGIVDEATNNSSIDLSQEHDAGWDLQIFTLLQVVAKLDSSADDVVRPASEVHVTNWALGKHKTSNQLGQVVGSNTISISGIDQATEGCDEASDEQGNNVGPGWKGDVLLDDDDKSKHEAKDE